MGAAEFFLCPIKYCKTGFLPSPYLHAIALCLEVHIHHMHVISCFRSFCQLNNAFVRAFAIGHVCYYFLQTLVENEIISSMLDGFSFSGAV